jgi:hypothetical protein
MQQSCVRRLAILVCSMLIGFPLWAHAADAVGYVWFQCPMTGDSHLHINALNGKRLRRELTLRIPEQGLWNNLEEKWYDYPGEECSSGECEPATTSKVQILHLSYSSFPSVYKRRLTGISGNFLVELRDGRKFSGSFRAKFRHHPKEVCD